MKILSTRPFFLLMGLCTMIIMIQHGITLQHTTEQVENLLYVRYQTLLSDVQDRLQLLINFGMTSDLLEEQEELRTVKTTPDGKTLRFFATTGENTYIHSFHVIPEIDEFKLFLEKISPQEQTMYHGKTTTYHFIGLPLFTPNESMEGIVWTYYPIHWTMEAKELITRQFGTQPWLSVSLLIVVGLLLFYAINQMNQQYRSKAFMISSFNLLILCLGLSTLGVGTVILERNLTVPQAERSLEAMFRVNSSIQILPLHERLTRLLDTGLGPEDFNGAEVFLQDYLKLKPNFTKLAIVDQEGMTLFSANSQTAMDHRASPQRFIDHSSNLGVLEPLGSDPKRQLYLYGEANPRLTKDPEGYPGFPFIETVWLIIAIFLGTLIIAQITLYLTKVSTNESKDKRE